MIDFVHEYEAKFKPKRQEYRHEWFDTAKAITHETGQVTTDAPTVPFRPPCEGAVLFLTLDDMGG